MYSLDNFPSEASNYTSFFNDVTKYPKISRVYIFFKIESFRSLEYLKHGNNTNMENIFYTVKEKTTSFVTKDQIPQRVFTRILRENQPKSDITRDSSSESSRPTKVD